MAAATGSAAVAADAAAAAAAAGGRKEYATRGSSEERTPDTKSVKLIGGSHLNVGGSNIASKRARLRKITFATRISW
jgi:hypothetical protein